MTMVSRNNGAPAAWPINVRLSESGLILSIAISGSYSQYKIHLIFSLFVLKLMKECNIKILICRWNL